MTLLVTGATGFLGEHVTQRLVQQYPRVICFVRPTSRRDLLPAGVEVRMGDLDEYPSWRAALQDVETLVNLASLGFGHAEHIVCGAKEARVNRAVFIGTTAVFTTLPARSKAARLEAERLIVESGLHYTLLRPTMIYGTPRDRNISRLIRFLRRSPVMPIFGDGQGLQQPVHVDDVADAIIACLEQDVAIANSYDVAGAEPLTFNRLVDLTAQALGRRVAKLHIPIWLALAGVGLYNALRLRPSFSREQVLRLNEDKAFDVGPAQRDFGYSPQSFEAGVRREVRLMRLGPPAQENRG